MGNLCCTPLVSGSGHTDYQGSLGDADGPSAQELRRSGIPGGNGSLPISPRSRSSEYITTLSDLPDQLLTQIGTLVSRWDRSALRQTAQVFNRVLLQDEMHAMHTIQGVHALLDMAHTAGSEALAQQVRAVIGVVPNMSRWQGKADLLLAAQHVVQQREDLPEREELRSEIASAIGASGLNDNQWKKANGVFASMLAARANFGAQVR